MQVYHILSVLTLISAHSWLHCVDYDQSASLNAGKINNDLCKSFPRGITKNIVFGVDYGFDHNPLNRVCKVGASQNNLNGQFIKKNRGQRYRILWPAKNHQSDECTNAFIPDTKLQMFAYKINDINEPDPDLKTWASPNNLFYDLKKNGKGFQNCPDFCKDTDKAPCFGDIDYSALSPGKYKILWLWEFNQGQLYSHCYDIDLINNSGGGPSPAPTPSPVVPQPFPTYDRLKCYRCTRL